MLLAQSGKCRGAGGGGQSPHGKHTYYACRRGPDGKLILMHREIVKTPPGMIVDHIHLDGLDNRRRYLRNCTQEQNRDNRAPYRGGSRGGK